MEVVTGTANASDVGICPMAVATYPVGAGTAHDCPLELLVVGPGAIWPIPFL